MNKLSQPELWEKIKNFNLDDPYSSFPISKKLAKENSWSPTFTNKAIEEYKKFIYLCCISPTGASPSETVDTVWHLHLTYTNNYWNLFCKQTLNKDIHHHPSKGGDTEKEKHQNWYDETIKFYTATFGSKPPADIWPQHEISTDDIHELIYDAAFFKRTIIGFITAILVYVTAVNLFHTKGENFLTHYIVLGVGGIVILFVTQVHKDDRLKNIVEKNLPKGYTTFQMARFLYGPHRSYQTALVDLLKRDIIETYGSDYKLIQHKTYDPEKENNPLLEPLMQNLMEGDTFSYTEGLGFIDRDTVLHMDIERLHRLSKKVDYQKLIIPGIILFIGLARFCQGIANKKPVGFLVFEMALFSMICLLILHTFSYIRSVRTQLTDHWLEENKNGYGNDLLNNFSILGTTAIQGFAEYTALSSVFGSVSAEERKWASSGSDGCSSSGGSGGGDGGGCGGGGCGGCGGGD